jgi:hypothetical protein
MVPLAPFGRILKSRAMSWPVWHDSMPVQDWQWPVPIRKRAASRLIDKAHKQMLLGRLMRPAVDVLRALLFGCLNYRTGRCDPSGATLAAKTGYHIATVWKAIAELRAGGWITRQRRCGTGEDGCRRQIRNAYVVHDPHPVAEAPPPEAGTWGDHPASSALDEAAAVRREGGGLAGQVAALQSDPGDRLALALASLGCALLR